MSQFKLVSKFQPTGDQPQAIKTLLQNLKQDKPFQTLLGVTGSGKTFTMANVIAEIQKPTLVIAHNKTLAAQLAAEYREFFPNNAVHYFVSYYDYYQPEAYLPTTDTYIEKDALINEEIERLRHAATTSLLTRQDVIIVASVSCIYGLGSPEDYLALSLRLEKGKSYPREEFLKKLVDMQYQRAHLEFKPGIFEVLGDVVEIYPACLQNAYQLEFFDDELEKITEIEPISGETIQELKEIFIFPAKQYVTSQEKIDRVIPLIRQDLAQRIGELQKIGKNLEAQRLRTRTEYDLEILQETGHVMGIENYSRYFDQRQPGEPPYTLINFFPADFLMIIDESHMTIPQINGMYNGDRARKTNLVEYGFRLLSTFDNRPLRFNEFEKFMRKVVFTSATPGSYELEKSKGQIVEQLIRPTGLIDPIITTRPTSGQIEDIIERIQTRIQVNERTLITTLTKRSSEDLTDFLNEKGIRVRYLHSEIETLERIEILRDLRLGKFDVLVGINLLREGLDLPEVSLICILDADKEGFLRSATALIQTIGRCARNVRGEVIMYADKTTAAMRKAIDETNRRRKIQTDYNQKHGITPTTIVSSIKDLEMTHSAKKDKTKIRLSDKDKKALVAKLELEMDIYAANLEFEKAAELRDKIEALK